MSQTCEARVCVSYQHWLILVYWGWMGDGWEVGGVGGCHSYHLTHELLQTQVDVDTLQMLATLSSSWAFFCSLCMSCVASPRVRGAAE